MSDIEDNLLLCASDVLSERVEAYNTITRNLSSQLHTIAWGEKIHSENVKKIISNVKQDLCSKEGNTAFETIGFLGCFLDNEKLMDCLSVQEEQETFDNLVQLLKSCEDKKILNRALWSFAQSKFGCDIYSKNIVKILVVIKDIMEEEQTGVTRYEALQVIKSLLESSPKDMKDNLNVWFTLVFRSFFHEAVRVRGIAYSCMMICKNMQQTESVDDLYTNLLPLIPELKDKHCKAMSMLIDEDCNYILKIWRLIITILDKHLHPVTALINGLLEVVEKAFKSSRPECRVDAFKCWQVLISNFALDAKVINHPKRLKLLSAPFKSNNAKTEEIANAKLEAWWHFVASLGGHCSDHFDIVIVPLLKYCFNTNGSSTSGFDRSYVMSGTSSPARKYPGLHIQSIEIFSAILATENEQNPSNYSSSITQPKQKIITPSVFLKNYQLIFSCVGDAMQILNTNNLTQYALGLAILNQLAIHVNIIITTDHHKRECVEMVKDLLATITVLAKANDSSNSFLLEFVKIFIIGQLALPSAVMNSRSYNIPVGSKPQELVSGTLNNFFIHKLLTPALLMHKSNENYEKLWNELLKKSNPSCGKLSFFEFTLEELNSAAPLLCSDSVDVFVDLWIRTCSQLHNYIQQENTIDQGDGSDYDWRCMYKYFLFPVRHSHDHLAQMENSSSFQRVVEMLKKMWDSFTSLCSLTATADPNCECDFIAKEMISLLTDKFTGPPDAIAFTLTVMAELLNIMLIKFRFKDLGKKSMKAVQSPARAKGKPHILQNLGSCIDLLCIIMEKAIRIVSSSRGKLMELVALGATLVCENIPKKYAWHFISSFSEVLRKAIMINPSAKYTPDVEVLFMRMWDEYIACLRNCVGKNISSDQLSKLSPLLITGLTSTHDGLKQKTKELWYNNFASTKAPIPSFLYEALKSAGLPPASISDTLTESQDTFYKSPGFLSRKPLSKENSPRTPGQKMGKTQSSPSSKKSTPKVSKSIFEMKDEDFVKVSSPSMKKRLLTPHQAEKMKSRGNDIPALYSDLSQSMSQLPPGFTTQDSLEQSIVENSLRSKELFPTNIKKEKSPHKKEEILPPEIALPPEKKKESPSKSYSDKDLNDILKDTSLELEKSLTETEKNSSPVSHMNNEEKENRLERKRKLDTPTKKSIDDVRNSLKGKKFTEKNEQTRKLRKVADNPLLVETASDSKRQPLKNMDKSPKKANLPVQKSSKEVIPDSDEEIPCSQLDDKTASKSIISIIGIDSPSGQDRPRRNKRKCLDDGYVYTTPTKRCKITPKKDDESNKKATEVSKSPNAKPKDVNTPTNSKSPKKNVSLTSKSIEVTAAPAVTMTNKPKPSAKAKTVEPSKSDIGKATVHNSSAKSAEMDVSAESDIVSAGGTGKKRRGRTKGATITEVQKLKHDNFDFEPKLLDSPTKVTRSGRRIVAPRKEIPEPISLTKKTEEKKLSPQKSPSLINLSPKSTDSPLASPIAQKVKSSPKSLQKLNLQKTGHIGDTGNVKLNRKLFDDSPNKDNISNFTEIVSDINNKIVKSPVKSPSPGKRDVQKLKVKSTVNRKECDSPGEINEKSATNTINRTDDESANQLNDAKVNTRKRKRTDPVKENPVKCTKIVKITAPVLYSEKETSVNVGDIDAPTDTENLSEHDQHQITNEHASESVNLNNSELLSKTHETTEDENMNMVQESPAKEAASNKSVEHIPTSFSGLINKQADSPNAKDNFSENIPKTATVIWSPSKRSPGKSSQAKVDVNDTLPFIFVRNVNANNEFSPVRKAQMLVLGQSPSSGKQSSPVKRLSPPIAAAKPSPHASPIKSLEKDVATVGESEETSRKQESPLGLPHSKLSNSISTPEVHQLRKEKIQHRSRAAAMLACARQAMKIKASDVSVSPSSGRFSRGSRHLSNGNSPLVGRKSGEIASGSSPWVRFAPSPNASPSNSILKRKKSMDEESVLGDLDFGTSPCLTKSRRVSFADPVFESIEIPPSPKVLKNMRAQKKLDMTKSCTYPPLVKEALPLKEVNKESSIDRILDSSKPIYPDLSCCREPVEELISVLAAPGMEKGLSDVLKTSSVNTIGDIAQLTESELHMFPVVSPKTERTLQILRDFATNQSSSTDLNATEPIPTNGTELDSDSTSDKDKTLEDMVATVPSKDSLICNLADDELLLELYSRLEKNSALVKQFSETVPAAVKEKLFESLLSYVPYARVIDIYSDFLKKQINL